MAIEHADFDGIERLALVTGGEIVSTFENPEAVKLGKCDVIEQVMIGEDILLRFGGVARGEACSIVIRGATQQIIDEADRSLHDALCVLAATVKESRIVYGGKYYIFHQQLFIEKHINIQKILHLSSSILY